MCEGGGQNHCSLVSTAAAVKSSNRMGSLAAVGAAAASVMLIEVLKDESGGVVYVQQRYQPWFVLMCL